MPVLMRASSLALAAAMALAPITVVAQTAIQSAPAATTPPPATGATDPAAVTIFGKRRPAADRTRTRLDTRSASGCAFMNSYDAEDSDVMQDYLQGFYGDDPDDAAQASGMDQTPADPADPDTRTQRFKDNAPFGDASQDETIAGNDLQGLRGDSGSATGRGGCGPSDRAFAAGRNYIARSDHSLQDAYAAFDGRDYPKALALFKASYQKMGYEAAALMEGKMYLAGLGTARDSKQAIMWLTKAAEGKFGPEDTMHFNPDDPDATNTRVDAAMTLARIYMTGYGIARSPVDARRWYLKADEFGYIPATHICGQIYQYGYGGETSQARAIGFYKKAATVGYAPSQYRLGVIYYTGDGIAADKHVAAGWLMEAAKRGNAQALYTVARMYDLGDTLPQDADKALIFYKEAALKGQPQAQDAIGRSFYTGEGVAKDLVVARKWFEAAASGGDDDAMFNLAVMLAHGEGGDQDLALAYVWFTLAARSGNDKGDAAAREISAKMTPADKAKADGILTPPKS